MPPTPVLRAAVPATALAMLAGCGLGEPEILTEETVEDEFGTVTVTAWDDETVDLVGEVPLEENVDPFLDGFFTALDPHPFQGHTFRLDIETDTGVIEETYTFEEIESEFRGG